MKKGFTELKKKPEVELDKELAAAGLELVKLRAQLATGAAAKEAGKLRNLKRKVARINTIRNMKK